MRKTLEVKGNELISVSVQKYNSKRKQKYNNLMRKKSDVLYEEEIDRVNEELHLLGIVLTNVINRNPEGFLKLMEDNREYFSEASYQIIKKKIKDKRL